MSRVSLRDVVARALPVSGSARITLRSTLLLTDRLLRVAQVPCDCESESEVSRAVSCRFLGRGYLRSSSRLGLEGSAPHQSSGSTRRLCSSALSHASRPEAARKRRSATAGSASSVKLDDQDGARPPPMPPSAGGIRLGSSTQRPPRAVCASAHRRASKTSAAASLASAVGDRSRYAQHELSKRRRWPPKSTRTASRSAKRKGGGSGAPEAGAVGACGGARTRNEGRSGA